MVSWRAVPLRWTAGQVAVCLRRCGWWGRHRLLGWWRGAAVVAGRATYAPLVGGRRPGAGLRLDGSERSWGTWPSCTTRSSTPTATSPRASTPPSWSSCWPGCAMPAATGSPPAPAGSSTATTRATSSTAPCPSGPPARRAAGAQHAAAGGDVHRAQPPAAQAHHHPAVLDLRGGVPRRARPAPSRADRPHAQLPMSRQLTLLNALS